MTAVIYRSIGGLLDHRPTSNLFRVGEASFEFSGCASLRLRYQFDANELGRRHAGLVGEQLLERIGGCSE